MLQQRDDTGGIWLQILQQDFELATNMPQLLFKTAVPEDLRVETREDETQTVHQTLLYRN